MAIDMKALRSGNLHKKIMEDLPEGFNLDLPSGLSDIELHDLAFLAEEEFSGEEI